MPNRWRRPSTVNAIHSPSIRTIVRSISGNTENGPPASTSAMLIRQSKSASSVPDGDEATSKVTPPPLRHGIRRCCSQRRTCIVDGASRPALIPTPQEPMASISTPPRALRRLARPV
jgi:hypothetical protein